MLDNSKMRCHQVAAACEQILLLSFSTNEKYASIACFEYIADNGYTVIRYNRNVRIGVFTSCNDCDAGKAQAM